MTRTDKARDYFRQGCACSQAVALAFADVAGIDEAALKKITLPFGGGLGRQRLTCGAVSGMCAIAGLVFAGEESTNDNKLATYAIVCELCDKFKAEKGSLICAELLSGKAISHEPGKPNPCEELVVLAVEILENYLTEKGVL